MSLFSGLTRESLSLVPERFLLVSTFLTCTAAAHHLSAFRRRPAPHLLGLPPSPPASLAPRMVTTPHDFAMVSCRPLLHKCISLSR